MATAVPTVDLNAAFDEAVAGRRVKVRRGRKAVAVVPVEDLERLEELDREDEEDDAALLEVSLEALAEHRASGEAGKPVEELRRELGLD